MSPGIVTIENAPEIMGQDFHGYEALDSLGIEPPIVDIPQIAVPQDKFERDKENCVLVLIPPISIREMLKKPSVADFFDRDENWPEDNPCLNRRGREWKWSFILKMLATGSCDKAWREQLTLLGNNEEVPFVRELVYAIIVHCVQTGERLFESGYARCQEPFSDKVPYVGFPQRGIQLRERDGGFCHPAIGLALARKI
jgi:predicted secreted protein